jgi:hypothetical protein
MPSYTDIFKSWLSSQAAGAGFHPHVGYVSGSSQFSQHLARQLIARYRWRRNTYSASYRHASYRCHCSDATFRSGDHACAREARARCCVLRA